MLLLCSWMISSSTFAGEKISQTLTVSPDGKLYIDITRGLVKVKGWDKAQISVMGELDDSVDTLIFKNKGDKTLIKAVAKKGTKHWGDSSVLKVFMPKQTQLYFKGVDATYTLASLDAGVEGKTISGDLLASQLSKQVALSSMGGSIKVLDSSGEIKLESVAGDIFIAGNYQNAQLRSMSGNIQLALDAIDELEAKTVSGKLHATGDVKANADIKLISVSGEIVLTTSEQLNAHCDVSSQFGGDIKNSLTQDKAKSSRMNGKKLSFVSGDGSGDLMLHTISGNITIEKGKAQ